MGFIKNYSQLATTAERKVVLDLIEAAIESIQPEKVLQNFSVPDLENYQSVYLIGFGKGSARISKIIEEKLGDKLTEGYVIDITAEQFDKIQFTQGTHPLPSQTNIDFTKKVVERFEGKLSEKDLILVVVCGGGSALFELPTVPLEKLLRLNDELLKSGKNIREINEERKKISKVKGGKLAQLLSPAKVHGLIFSDVPGNDLFVISSGPTIANLPNVINTLMLSNKTALDAMKKKANELGLSSQIYFDEIQGEARNVGVELMKMTNSNSILLAAGETTVTVKNPNGKGGRNQELVLGALQNINENVTIASFDSDGWDNSEFAGAIADLSTLNNVKEQNLNIEEFLNNNNSFEFFEKVRGGISTGRLPSNVADLMIVFRK